VLVKGTFNESVTFVDWDGVERLARHVTDMHGVV